MIRRDMPEVLEIESRSFQWPWDEEDFIRVLRNRTCIGKVVEIQEQVVAYEIYELRKHALDILSMAVHPDFRRQGLGAALIEQLMSKLHQDRRTRITGDVRERNLEAQCFLRSVGLRAVQVLRHHYDNTAEDCYRFAYRVPAAVPAESS